VIELDSIRLNNAQNKTYLKYDGSVTFHDDTIYFIIGRSGVGKTSLVDFMAAPFTDDPIKNGNIKISGDIALKTRFAGRPIEKVEVKNSRSLYSKEYYDFMRKSVALIPQKTDSFHPAIPLREQMYYFYKMALPAEKTADLKEFSRILEELSEFSGWDKVKLDENDKKAIRLADSNAYVDDLGNHYPIVDIQLDDEKKSKKTYESELSSGQLQRLLILMGLIQFSVSANPLLIGDEFLVNFTYPEANDVLEKVINFFIAQKKNHKIAVFIQHDLSFYFLKDLPKGYPIRLIGMEEDPNYKKDSRYETRDARRLLKHEMDLNDFVKGRWQNAEDERFFKAFRDSYEGHALPREDCCLDIDISDENARFKIDCKVSKPWLGVYSDIQMNIGKNRFIVLTGFSGCGKTTLCNQFLRDSGMERQLFRYFPSRALSSLSDSSQISIKTDLGIMFHYYNRLDGLTGCKDVLKEMILKIHYYEDSTEGAGMEESGVSDDKLEEFLDKKIYDLSGGQQQRYWLIRLLFNFVKNGVYKKPELLILDESIASLDCITKNKIIGLLLKYVFFDIGGSVLFVSHDLRDIEVIYRTLFAAVGEEKIDKVFEHYEMFNKNIYRVRTNFPEYRRNLYNKTANRYESLKDGVQINLHLDKG
jgi:ABC-type dipeptide/oligopeptide/nickel transport system ATPase subunit